MMQSLKISRRSSKIEMNKTVNSSRILECSQHSLMNRTIINRNKMLLCYESTVWSAKLFNFAKIVHHPSHWKHQFAREDLPSLIYGVGIQDQVFHLPNLVVFTHGHSISTPGWSKKVIYIVNWKENIELEIVNTYTTEGKWSVK